MSSTRRVSGQDPLTALPAKVRTSVRHALDAYCDTSGETRSEVVERALVSYLASPQATSAVLNNAQSTLAMYGQSLTSLSTSVASNYSQTLERLGGNDAPQS